MPALQTYQDNLQSERLFTRFLTTHDIPAWATFFDDKEAVKLFLDFGFTESIDKATFWINRQLTRYDVDQCGLQALIHKNTKEFIGQCGLISQQVDDKDEIEVAYHIFGKYWRQGYATEAAKLFINYAFENNLTESVISIIDVRNIKSQSVAAKNKLIIDKQTNWMGLDVFIYRIYKSDWDNRKETDGF